MKSKIAIADAGATRRAEGRFYVGMALVALLIAIVGFGPALINPVSRKAPVTLAVAAHGVVFCAWPLLFLIQAILIPKGIAVHRRLGYLGLGLAVLMVVTGYFTAVAMARRGYDLSGDLMNTAPDALFILVFQFGDLLTFALLVGAGVWYRHRPNLHKRLMLLAIVGTLVPAALTHIWAIPRLCAKSRRPLYSSRSYRFFSPGPFTTVCRGGAFTLCRCGCRWRCSSGRSSASSSLDRAKPGTRLPAGSFVKTGQGMEMCSPNQRVEAMTRSAVMLMFQSSATGALLVMPHPSRQSG